MMQRVFAAEFVGAWSLQVRRYCFNDAEKEKLAEFYYKANGLTIFVYDKPCDMARMFMLAKKAVDNDRACLVVVDHVGLVQVQF